MSQDSNAVILNIPTSLGYGSASHQITDAIATAIKTDPEPPTVFLATFVFIEDVAGRFAHDTVVDHDAVSDAAANTNAYFAGAYLEATEPEEALVSTTVTTTLTKPARSAYGPE